MNTSIKNSLNKIRVIESQQLAEAAPAITATAGKGLGRFIPGVGAAIGAYDAYNRAKQGDYTGAALSGIGGAASLIPGIGTAASIGIAGAQAIRDKSRTGSYLPGEEEISAAVAKDKTAVVPPVAATTPVAAQTVAKSTVNPQVLDLQKKLITKGAKIAADGIMGPKTQAAMKQFPEVQLSSKINKIKGTYMSESDKIAALRDRLAQFEVKLQPPAYDKKTGSIKESYKETSEITLEAGVISGLVKGAKALGQAAKTGFSGAPVATGKVTAKGAAQTASQGSQTFKKALAATPKTQQAAYAAGKTAKAIGAPVAAGAIGAGAGYMAGKYAGGSAPTTPGTAAGGAAGKGAGGSTTPAERAELDALASELGRLEMMGVDPELDNLLLQYQKLGQ